VGLPLLFTVSVLFEAGWALAEELGWRGFLFPRLHQRFGFHGACLISGLLWAVWHFPEIVWTDFNPGTNTIFALCCFTIMVVALSYIMGYLRLRSASLWPCVLLHATHNNFIQGLFDPLTASVGRAKYITTEFGAGLAIAMVIAATVIISTGRPHKDFPLSSQRVESQQVVALDLSAGGREQLHSTVGSLCIFHSTCRKIPIHTGASFAVTSIRNTSRRI
jgi:uncharacterized protein